MKDWEIENFLGELLVTKPSDYHPNYLRKLATLQKVLTNFLENEK